MSRRLTCLWRAPLHVVVCLVGLSGCSKQTAMLLDITQSDSIDPQLRTPDDVDKLILVVSVSGRLTASQDYNLSGPGRVLAESVTLLPGKVSSGSIFIEVNGLKNQSAVLYGALETSFEDGRVVERSIRLDFASTACLDSDGDGYGRGPGCLGVDCDDAQPSVYPESREACDGIDNDCDEAVDEQLDAPRCEKALGVCANAYKECGGTSGWLDCTVTQYGPRYEIDEITLDDGFDNDCDGAIDEGGVCQDGQARPCSGPLVGICDPGTQHCYPAGGGFLWSTDCVDQVSPRPEQCDQLDDDCDEQTDEDFDFSSDVAHCGECDHACFFPHGSGNCSQGDCVLTGCQPGWFNIDTEADDGCEYECQPTEPASEICDEKDNDCDGRTDNLPDLDCELTVGVCIGASRSCTPDGGLGECDYGPDYEEVETRCDGLDNDCDDLTDEMEPAACEQSLGVCAGVTRTCQGADGWSECNYGADYQTEETHCDGLDNDCDDLTDEMEPEDCELTMGVCAGVTRTCQGADGWSECSYGSDYEEIEARCDQKDNDCDDLTDEMDPVACPLNQGVCTDSTGELACVDGDWTGCNYGPDFEGLETRCDGLDNDCDGATDGADPDLVLPACERTEGVCAGTVHTADLCLATGWELCPAEYYGPDFEVIESSCDNKDNDCDSDTDDVAPLPCPLTAGVCAGGEQICVLGFWSDCDYGANYEETEQTCDGLDNDCDSVTDEPESTSCPGFQICQSGSCVCPAGLTPCDDDCVDTQMHRRHCNGCDQGCGYGHSCEGGACVEGCPGGTFLPGGGEFNDYCVTSNQGPGTCCEAHQRCAAIGAQVGYFRGHEPFNSEFASLLPGPVISSVYSPYRCNVTCYTDIDTNAGWASLTCEPGQCTDTGNHCEAGCALNSCNNFCEGCACEFPFWCYFSF